MGFPARYFRRPNNAATAVESAAGNSIRISDPIALLRGTNVSFTCVVGGRGLRALDELRRPSIDELEHDIGTTLPGAVVVNAQHVGVLQLRQSLGLALEAPTQPRV